MITAETPELDSVPQTSSRQNSTILSALETEPWPEPVGAGQLLDDLRATLTRFVVLPNGAAETLALWILHTHAFELRDVSTYIGIESPTRRCGKTTLLTVLGELVNRPIIAANVSSPAFFRAIEELRPTLMIDEADTFLRGNDELHGILNAGYHRKSANVLRVASISPVRRPPLNSASPSPNSNVGLAFFSCWCPKVISRIGKLSDTLADRCILVRMQRKTSKEACDRLKNLDGEPLRRKCARFILDHAAGITAARPGIPASLNDRAADIWEPLLALADLAGGEWPNLARQAAVTLSTPAPESSAINSLLIDIWTVFIRFHADRIFSFDLVRLLSQTDERPWKAGKKPHHITEQWLAGQLKPFGVRPRNLVIASEQRKGYLQADFMEVFRRYVSKSEVESFVNDCKSIEFPLVGTTSTSSQIECSQTDSESTESTAASGEEAEEESGPQRPKSAVWPTRLAEGGRSSVVP